MAKKKKIPPNDNRINTEWEKNNESIYSAFIVITNEKKRYPTVTELSDKTGLSIDIISQHFSHVDLDQIKKKYTVFADAVLFQLATKALSGKSKQWTELYFKVVFGLGDKPSANENQIINTKRIANNQTNCNHVIHYDEENRTYICKYCGIDADKIF